MITIYIWLIILTVLIFVLLLLVSSLIDDQKEGKCAFEKKPYGIEKRMKILEDDLNSTIESLPKQSKKIYRLHKELKELREQNFNLFRELHSCVKGSYIKSLIDKESDLVFEKILEKEEEIIKERKYL